ncbi:MAG: CBS domain-containing protein [Methylobacterium sp.]|jgi:CBS domain-containing protein|nr:CBS domain-containing protein [Methylobacterium sp.]MCA3607424.1 CBS domain-containing protein [Methylobacterium sp.]MCA3608638.1 CBS domain-containing protein [Methylobacterium sp.]MCA3618717.1 CBS domain-containing protein [Methylobacterium sp.]MCA3621280.1 CBS domain-containing protein [Methylobacterium sp.]
MSVGRLLDSKGHAVITVRADQTLHEASRLLAEYRIGAVVIAGEGGSVAGILSERDIVRALAQHGADALNHPVSQHMTRKVVTCTVAMALQEVMEIMTAGKFRHLPVLKDGRLDGMISIGDVVKYRLAQLENESRSLRDYIAAN